MSTALSRAGDIMPYQIEGTIQAPVPAQFAYLFIPATPLQPSQLISVPISNNRFIIRGSVNQAAGKYSLARLFISEKEGIKKTEYSTLLQNGKLDYRELILEEQVNITIGETMIDSEVKGGALNDGHTKLQEIMQEAIWRSDSLKLLYQGAISKSKKKPVETKRIQVSYSRLFKEQQDWQTSELLNYIFNNSTSVFALEKLEMLVLMKEPSWRKFMRDFDRLLPVLPEKWLQSPKGKLLVQKIKAVKASQRLVTDAILPDYIFRDGGDSVAIRDFQGKYLLIQFWTSWSESCKAVQNDLITAYKSYGNKGLAILQVSLDLNMKNWKMALPEKGVTWKQARCKMGWDAQVEKTFEIYGVPTSYLVDKEGKIFADNLWGKELADKLAEMLP